MARCKQLPKPLKRHYVGEPVIVIPLVELEALLQHMIDIAMLDRKTPDQRNRIINHHTVVIEQCRHEITKAKRFYHIVS